MSVAAPFGRAATREDAEAARLYAEHSDRVLTYCLRRLGSRSEAEDAAQVTFLHALRALRRGVVPISETAWLLAIARNVCRRHLRTESRRPLAGGRRPESLAGPEPDEDERELVDGLREALAGLPERQRQALLLREWRGLSAPEIGARLGLSTPATYALVTRARRSLARALTAPKRAALGLASFAYDLRSLIKAAAGPASVKAGAVATAAAVAAAGATVTSDRLSARARSAPDAIPVSDVRRDVSRGARSVGEVAPGPHHVGMGRVGGRSGLVDGVVARDGERIAIRPWIPPGGRTAHDSVPPPADLPAPRAPPGDADPQPRAESPEVETPTVDLPGVDLPGVDAAPADVPTVELPPLDTPGDALPTVDPPSVDAPTVDLPPVDLPALEPPPLELPSLGG